MWNKTRKGFVPVESVATDTIKINNIVSKDVTLITGLQNINNKSWSIRR